MTNQKDIRQQVATAIRILEEKGDIYDITLNGEPLWWFARIKVYDKLLQNINNAQKCHPKRRILDYIWGLIYILFKFIVILGRTLYGLWRSRSIGQPGKVLVFAASNDYRGRPDGGLHTERDVFLGDVIEKLGKNAVVLERPTSTEWDFRSLFSRKNAIFWDYMLVLAAIKCALHPRPKIERLEELSVIIYAVQEKLPLKSYLLIETIQQIMNEILRKVQIQTTAAEMLLEKVKPSRILEVTSYDGACVALNLAAKKRGIPVVEIQHGIIYPSHPGYAVMVPDERKKFLPVPEKILVYGEKFKEYLSISTIFYQNRVIRVVGSPRLNKFLGIMQRNGRTAIRNSVRKKLNLQDNQIVIVMTTQKPVADRLVAFCQKSLRILPANVHICLKPHPGELGKGLAIYRMLTKDRRLTIITDNTIDLYELLIASDLHVSSYSTVLLEAMALGVPNFVIELEDGLPINDIFTIDGFNVIHSPQEMLDIISRFENEPSWINDLLEREQEIARGFFSTSVPDTTTEILNELFT